MSSSPVYDGKPWADEYWKEERIRYNDYRFTYAPFVVWGMPVWRSSLVNEVETPLGPMRKTVNPVRPSCGPTNTVKVWVFGGSTVWGIGTPDWGTIPSFLSKILNAESDKCYEVTNLGVDAYVTNQELILLMQKLKEGARPNIVVFYDGINEAWVGAFSPGLPATHYLFGDFKDLFEGRRSFKRRLLERSYSFRVVRDWMGRARGVRSGEPGRQDLEANAAATVDNYLRNIALISLLGREYGFKTYFFWQPALPYGNKPRSPFERAIIEYPLLIDHEREETGRQVIMAVKAVFEEASRRSAATHAFSFLGDTFDGHRETVYLDWAHLGPEGNEVVARTMAATIR